MRNLPVCIALHVVRNLPVCIALHGVRNLTYSIACCAKSIYSFAYCAKSIYSMVCCAKSIHYLACCVKPICSLACCAKSISGRNSLIINRLLSFISGFLKLLFENTYINELFCCERAQQMHFYLKIKDCILYIKGLYACSISQKT